MNLSVGVFYYCGKTIRKQKTVVDEKNFTFISVHMYTRVYINIYIGT